MPFTWKILVKALFFRPSNRLWWAHNHCPSNTVLTSLVQKFGLDGAKPLTTPLAFGTSLTATEGTLLFDPTLYCHLVRSLQYLILKRPDISYDVHQICQVMQTPWDTHLIIVKRIFWYLKGTLNLGLHFIRAPLTTLHSFCDADWADCKDDQRSTTSFAIYIGDELLSKGAKKQSTLSRSMDEAKYHVLASTLAKFMCFMNTY